MKQSLFELTRRETLLGTAAAVAGLASVGSVTASADTLTAELNAVRAATRTYRDVQLAREDGYAGLISPYVPGMGFHFINPALIAPDEDAEVDITKPPMLVYYTTGNYRPEPGDEHDPAHDGDLRLGAVEFAHMGTLNAPANYFSDEESRRSLAVSEEEGWHPSPDSPFTALHVWVHRGNPAGVFHPTNPTLN